MKKTTLTIIAALAPLIANATTIDLGPPDNHVVGEYQVPWTSNVASFDGQHLTLDLSFSGGEFIKILAQTNKSFLLAPLLLVHGTGTIAGVSGSGYSTGVNGEQNSVSWFYNGGSIQADNETFFYSLGYVYPMFVDTTGKPRTDVDALDVYGLHFDIMLPTSTDFEIIGAAMFFTPSTGDKFRGTWAIGPHVPDTGSTAMLLSLGLLGCFLIRNRP